MNANGLGLTNKTKNSAVDQSPAWSPDATRIAFASSRDGDFEIYVMNATDGSVIQLTDNSVITDITPAWSPNGQKIAFTRDGDIYVMDAGGSNQTPLTSGVPSDSEPAWSPNGQKIAFTRDGDIYVMDAGGSPPTLLLDDPVGASEPDWQP